MNLRVNKQLWLNVLLPSFLFFWPHHTACRILVPWSGIEPGPQQWKHWVPTSGPPGNSLNFFIYVFSFINKEGMTELAYHYFAITNELKDIGNRHQWSTVSQNKTTVYYVFLNENTQPAYDIVLPNKTKVCIWSWPKLEIQWTNYSKHKEQRNMLNGTMGNQWWKSRLWKFLQHSFSTSALLTFWAT